MQNITLLYDTFNAKYLSFKDVAESFVENDEFFEIIRNNSMLLMGPRGCGKTTLLKMLTTACQYYWKSPNAKITKDKINFTAVYIPSDIQWKNQFEYLNLHLKNDHKLIEVITQFLFASNIQIALCKAFNSYLVFNDFDLNKRLLLEHNICKSLRSKWNLNENTTPTFDELELSLLLNIRDINTIIKSVIFKNVGTNIDFNLPNFVFDNFFDLIKIGCKIFEQNLEINIDHKWALCFDELEIVPKFIQLELVKYLRSVDQKYIFKLTTTPLFNLENSVVEASQGNDFNTVKLWVYDSVGLKRWQLFCSKLLLNRFEKKYSISNSDLKEIFGEYNLDDIIKDELNSLSDKDKASLEFSGIFRPGLAKGSSMNFLFKKLSLIDSSFASFLIKRKINPLDPHTNDKIIAKSIFLKYKTEATFRLVYKDRTRKQPPIHYGLPYIFDICDGNPRLVIGLIDEIIQSSKYKQGASKSISKQEQSQIIFEASEKYYNVILNHPDATINTTNGEINLANDILDKIGRYFQDKLLKDSFSKNIPSTFRIDQDINQKYLKLLETGLSLGAIIYLDPIESLSNKGIIDKRFRLSGFLAPKYKIPPSRVSSEVKLSSIFKVINTKQMTIFD